MAQATAEKKVRVAKILKIPVEEKKDIITTKLPPIDTTKYKVVTIRSMGGREKEAIYPIEPINPLPPDIEEEKKMEYPHYSYVRILQELDTGDYIYEVIEPQLSEREEEILEYLEEVILDEFDVDADEFETLEEKKKALRKIMNETLFHSGLENLDAVTKEKLFYYLYRDFIGYGKIQVMMIDPMLEDVSCDGFKVPIYVYHREFQSIKSNVMFDTPEEINRFVIQIAQKCGREISKANPVLDATMPDGSRLNTTLGSEVTTRGSTFTIRRFREVPLTIIDLISGKSMTMSSEMAAFLWMAVQYGASLMCAGGTASGKTTTLNALALFIPPSAKIVTIEDTREINIPHENWIPGLTREVKDSEAAGGARNIDMFELLKAAMRQRPDYMIVGEVRGKETMTVFQAMATGQTVYSTLHADSVASVVHRLENPPINIPRILVLSLNFVLLQAQVRVQGKKTRRVKQIAEIIDLDPDTNHIRFQPVFTWTPGTYMDFKYAGHSKFLDKVAEMENMTHEEIKQELKNREIVLKWLLRRKMNDEEIKYNTVFKTIQNYYQEPEKVVEEAKAYLDKFGDPYEGVPR